MFRMVALVIVAPLLCGTVVRAQAPPSTSPATRFPAAHRGEIPVPPGFASHEIAGCRVMCEPADEPWVRDAFAARRPTTRPYPMPGELLERVAIHREAIQRELAVALALPDAAAVAPLFDERVIRALRDRAEEQERPLGVAYLVLARPRLKEIVTGGWTDGRIRYDKASDRVLLPPADKISFSVLLGHEVFPVVYDASDPPVARRAALDRGIEQLETYATDMSAGKARHDVEQEFLSFIWDTAYEPLGQNDEAAGWLGLGIAGVLTARHAAPILGETPEAMYARMSAQPTTPIFHPHGDPAMVRSFMSGIWRDRERRWAMVVVSEWTRRGGDGAIAKLLAALRKRKTPPTNRVQLVRVIRESTGVDLTRDMGQHLRMPGAR